MSPFTFEITIIIWLDLIRSRIFSHPRIDAEALKFGTIGNLTFTLTPIFHERTI